MVARLQERLKEVRNKQAKIKMLEQTIEEAVGSEDRLAQAKAAGDLKGLEIIYTRLERTSGEISRMESLHGAVGMAMMHEITIKGLPPRLRAPEEVKSGLETDLSRLKGLEAAFELADGLNKASYVSEHAANEARWAEEEQNAEYKASVRQLGSCPTCLQSLDETAAEQLAEASS